MKTLKTEYLIIGNSASGAACIEGIRKIDKTGSIAVISDENIFNSKYTMWMVKDNVSKYMPDFKDKLKGTVVPFGLYNSQDVVKNKKFDKFTFVYNHRLQAYKNWETTFEIFIAIHIVNLGDDFFHQVSIMRNKNNSTFIICQCLFKRLPCLKFEMVSWFI